MLVGRSIDLPANVGSANGICKLAPKSVYKVKKFVQTLKKTIRSETKNINRLNITVIIQILARKVNIGHIGSLCQG